VLKDIQIFIRRYARDEPEYKVRSSRLGPSVPVLKRTPVRRLDLDAARQRRRVMGRHDVG
jgi:hypothetical protein